MFWWFCSQCIKTSEVRVYGVSKAFREHKDTREASKYARTNRKYFINKHHKACLKWLMNSNIKWLTSTWHVLPTACPSLDLSTLPYNREGHKSVLLVVYNNHNTASLHENLLIIVHPVHSMYSARRSPENTHKLMWFYMEDLILGIILQYTLSAFLTLYRP